MSATARSPRKRPLKFFWKFPCTAVAWLPARRSIAPWRPTIQRDRNRPVLRAAHHLTVCEKNIGRAGTNQRACASSRQPVIPPAPLTGDVGRGCGDASRALLFSAVNHGIASYRPTNRPTITARHRTRQTERQATWQAACRPAEALTMPLRKPTLSFGVTSFWPFSISDDQWNKVETHCGFAIPLDLRSAIVAKTQTMRWRSCEAWQSALPTREAIKRIDAIKKAAVDWLNSDGWVTAGS